MAGLLRAAASRARRRARETLADGPAFDARPVAILLRNEHLLAIGDSHVRALSRVRVPSLVIQTLALKGATASGILNTESKTKAHATFMHRLERAKRWQHIAVQLGEVDCGYVIWHRAARRGLSIDQQLAQTVETYASFVERVASFGFRSVTVLSAPLPTIGDDPAQWGRVASRRQEVTASQRERTDLTLRFNDRMAAAAERVGARFVDATTMQLDPATGLIQRRFVKRSGDHHLASGPYAEVLAAGLRRLRWR